jgi:hypothetical protein
MFKKLVKFPAIEKPQNTLGHIYLASQKKQAGNARWPGCPVRNERERERGIKRPKNQPP